MSKYGLVIGVLLVVVVLGLFLRKKPEPSTAGEIRYVAVGDSYTIGQGVREHEAWPSVLTEHLRQEGIKIKLVANPSVSGWTTQEAIDRELPVYDKSDPAFATLMIGANDWAQGVSSVEFRSRLITLMDHMLDKLPDKRKMIVLTIPDFSAAPAGAQFAGGRTIPAGIQEFNIIISEEAKKRNLEVVDVFPVSQKMASNPQLVAADGLHPSAAEYAEWEKLIYPVALQLLKETD